MPSQEKHYVLILRILRLSLYLRSCSYAAWENPWVSIGARPSLGAIISGSPFDSGVFGVMSRILGQGMIYY